VNSGCQQAITGRNKLTKCESRCRTLYRCALLCSLISAACFAQARVAHSDAWARERFARAEQLQEALNGRPASERTRKDYQRVLDAYRLVYFGAPVSTKADPSVVSCAELLVEMGRQFEDDKILHSAIEQYQFLRREYPGSRYRFDALFTIGEIYKDDLDDPDQARASFEEFLRRYPRHHLADDARDALNEISEQASRKEAEARQAKSKKPADTDDQADNTRPERKRGRLPRVTSIRHWSTPDYTRVAIDLEQEVKFDSQRIDHPDRIFFDLRDTKLASTLVGKTFDVDDDFLKKIRVAQFQPGRTRVVLEVDNLSNYDAFLLPNPYRLIIDIHGKKTDTLVAKAEPSPVSSNGEGLREEDIPPLASKDAQARDAQASDRRPKASSSAIVPVASADSKSAPATINSTSVVLTPAGPKLIPKKIVEADDDDDSSVPDVTSAQVTKNARPSSHKQSDETEPPLTLPSSLQSDKAISSSTKRRSADGNNDEVATLAPRAATEAAQPAAKPEITAQRTTTDATAIDELTPSDRRKSRSKSRANSKTGKLATTGNDQPEIDAREARPTASGDRSLIRALGLKIGRIVIDPGHGGHDTGTIGPDGLQEKDLVLEVGRRLGKLLESRLGADVIYTRQDDTFIPLETRTAIANREEADLFVSIHANSSDDPNARGVETYYLNFTSSRDALEVAARENAVSENSIHELQGLVKKIALKEKIEESREFATDVQQSLHSGLAGKNSAIRDRGVKKAPFIVLIGANMPSILAEISFVSNPTDEHKLETAEYRQRIAESLYRGIARYVNGLSGVKVASKVARAKATTEYPVPNTD